LVFGLFGFGWPNGITVWALFFTLMALAEQTQATRIAAEASSEQAAISRQALVAQFRPKIIVRKMRLDPSATLYFDRRGEDSWKIELHLHNSGGSVAHVRKCEGFFQVHDGSSGWTKESIAFLLNETLFDIPAGGKHQLDLPLPAERFRKILGDMEASSQGTDVGGAMRDDYLVFNGTITHRDDNGIDRDTGFSRNLYMKTAKFLASDDPNEEYQE
jgi:hypothetical protein